MSTVKHSQSQNELFNSEHSSSRRNGAVLREEKRKRLARKSSDQIKYPDLEIDVYHKHEKEEELRRVKKVYET